jgi:hypothetical protein
MLKAKEDFFFFLHSVYWQGSQAKEDSILNILVLFIISSQDLFPFTFIETTILQMFETD